MLCSRGHSLWCIFAEVFSCVAGLVRKDSHLLSCCRTVKMQMTDSISCYRKRICGPPLETGVLSLRRSPNRSLVRSGADCRPSICGWRSSCCGVCLLTECVPKPPLQSTKKNLYSSFWQGRQAQPHRPIWRKILRGAAIKEVQEGSRDLQQGHPSVTKGASPSAKHPSKVPFTKAWRGLHLRKASRGFTFGKGSLRGLKEAWRGLQGGFKGASRGLEGGLNGAWRGLEGGFTFGKVQRGLKRASRGLKGSFKPSEREERFERLEGDFKGASRGLQEGLKGASRGLHLRKASRRLEGDFKEASRELEAFRRWRGLWEAWRGLKGVSRWLERAFKGNSPSEGFKGAWRSLKEASRWLEGGLNPSSEADFEGTWRAWRGLQGGLQEFHLREALRGLQEGLKGASRRLKAFSWRETWRELLRHIFYTCPNLM